MKDWVTVYDCGSGRGGGRGGGGDKGGWGEAARFQLPTADAADIAWSPAGGVLAAWESCLGDKVRGAVWVLGGWVGGSPYQFQSMGRVSIRHQAIRQDAGGLGWNTAGPLATTARGACLCPLTSDPVPTPPPSPK